MSRMSGTHGVPLAGATALARGSGSGGVPDQLYVAVGTGLALHIPATVAIPSGPTAGRVLGFLSFLFFTRD